jgi:carboxylesterase type B
MTGEVFAENGVILVAINYRLGKYLFGSDQSTPLAM